jgi:4-amino-4-deoxy-L-arabinose transferase-like glycosyltransferase
MIRHTALLWLWQSTLREVTLGAQGIFRAECFLPKIFPDPVRRRLTPVLRSSTLAVVVAYLLRMALLWLSSEKAIAHPTFQVLGMEEGRVAWSLATGKGFSGTFPGYESVTAWLAPVYPFLWAICIRLSRLNSEAAVLLGQTMNCAFSAATCWPVYSTGKKLFNEKVGLASAWMWVFLPFAILIPLEWAWDQSLSALILALIVDATLRLRESMSPLSWSGYGLLWGLAALVNPALCGLLPFLLGWLIFQRWRSGVVTAALYARVALIFVLAVLPWTIRNFYAVDSWIFVKSNFGLELWIGNHPGSDTQALHPMYSFPERIRLIMEGEPNYSRDKERAAVGYIKAHPGEFARKTWGRILDTWTANQNSWVDGWIAALQLSREDVWVCSAFSVLSLAGLLLALRNYGMDSLPLVICLIVFPIPYYITNTTLRYRHPIDPLMTILAAYAISRLWAALAPRPAMQSLQTISAEK